MWDALVDGFLFSFCVAWRVTKFMFFSAICMGTIFLVYYLIFKAAIYVGTLL
jgi:hypothetical protein